MTRPNAASDSFDSDASAIRWFYHTARAHANCYESCQLRDALRALAKSESKTPEQIETAKKQFSRCLDEKANAEAALPSWKAMFASTGTTAATTPFRTART